MFNKKTKIVVTILILLSMLFSGLLALTDAQSDSKPCDSCGMALDATAQARFRITDSANSPHVACCPICALKLLKTYGELTITSFCDYNGPSCPITINAKQSGSVLTISPQSAIIILGGGCTKNRLVYNAAAADALLSDSNKGTSKWLSPLTNAIVLPNAARISLAQAVLQYGGGVTSACEQCGMTVDVTGQARFKVFDAAGTLHIACCPNCALRLQRTYNDLNITAFCDYYGPNYPITIISKSNGTDVTVNPSEALIISGSCTKSRIVYNSTAADELLAAPNNGTSKYLSSMSNDTVAADAARMSIVQAALINGAGLPSSTPTPTPSPSPSLSPTPSLSPPTPSTPLPLVTPSPTPQPTTTNVGILECEVCGMDVTPESQARYQITDGTGKVHYVECFMCAMQLVNDYSTLKIETYCDWYGPNYPITIKTSNFGQSASVSPTTAIFLRGRSCVTARVAYNQTAADNLLANGFSKNTSPEQQYALPSTTQVKLVNDAIGTWYAKADTTAAPASLTLGVALAVGVVIIVGSVFAFKKLKST